MFHNGVNYPCLLRLMPSSILGSSSLLLLLEEEDSLDIDNELPKWLIFPSLMEIVMKIWRWWWDGFGLVAEGRQFHSTSEAVTFDGPGRNHYVWYGWMRRDGGFTAMPLVTLLAKNWWSYSCFSPFFEGGLVSWSSNFFWHDRVQLLMEKNSDSCLTSVQGIIAMNHEFL